MFWALEAKSKIHTINLWNLIKFGLYMEFFQNTILKFFISFRNLTEFFLQNIMIPFQYLGKHTVKFYFSISFNMNTAMTSGFKQTT